jgi:hypothetical protein
MAICNIEARQLRQAQVHACKVDLWNDVVVLDDGAGHTGSPHPSRYDGTYGRKRAEPLDWGEEPMP